MTASPSAKTSPLARAAAAVLRTRWIVRAPILVYRARLGAIFGTRLLMLEHTGRKTGTRRYAVLEIVDHPTPGSFMVVSGFGMRAQWLRNVEADPRVRVSIGSHRPQDAVARRVDLTEATEILTRYANAHPKTWQQFEPVLRETLQDPTPEPMADKLPVVSIVLLAP